MPKPKPNETEQAFISRCMAWPDLQDKPEKERAGECYGLWNEHHGKSCKLLQELEAREKAIAKAAESGQFASLRNYAFKLSPGRLGLACKGAKLLGVDESVASARFCISTPSMDRDGDVILPTAVIPLIDRYKANPRVLWCHQQDGLPIASARTPDGELALEVFEDSIESTAFFHLKTELSEQVYDLVVAKELEASSIGFGPVDGERLDDDEEEQLGAFQVPGFVFTVIDLHEWSVVPVPAQAEAIARRLSVGRAAGRPLNEVLTRTLQPFAAKPTIWSPGWSNQTRSKMSEKAPGNDVQAVLCLKSKFPTSEEAAKYCEAKGFKVDQMEDTADAYAFIQFPSDKCMADSAKQEQLEDGCTAVICQQQVEDGGANKPETPATNPNAGDGKAAKPCACGQKAKGDGDADEDDKGAHDALLQGREAGSAGKPIHENPYSVSQIAEYNAWRQGWEEGGGKGKETPIDERPGEKPDVPLGLSVLRGIMDHMAGMIDGCDKNDSMLEHPEVKDYVAAIKEEMAEKLEDLADFAKELYPEHHQEPDEDDKDEADGDGDEMDGEMKDEDEADDEEEKGTGLTVEQQSDGWYVMYNGSKEDGPFKSREEAMSRLRQIADEVASPEDEETKEDETDDEEEKAVGKSSGRDDDLDYELILQELKDVESTNTALKRELHQLIGTVD